MSYKVNAVTVVKSVTIELDTAQLQMLANSQVHLQRVCEQYDHNELNPDGRPLDVVALDPLMELVEALAKLAGTTTLAPVKKVGIPFSKNPRPVREG